MNREDSFQRMYIHNVRNTVLMKDSVPLPEIKVSERV